MPMAGRRAARYWELVSVISPRRISVPTEMISARIGERIARGWKEGGGSKVRGKTQEWSLGPPLDPSRRRYAQPAPPCSSGRAGTGEPGRKLVGVGVRHFRKMTAA